MKKNWISSKFKTIVRQQKYESKTFIIMRNYSISRFLCSRKLRARQMFVPCFKID